VSTHFGTHQELSRWTWERQDGIYVVVCAVDLAGFSLSLYRWGLFRNKRLLVKFYSSVEEASAGLKKCMELFASFICLDVPLDIPTFTREI
jgi:hypothetical protein